MRADEIIARYGLKLNGVIQAGAHWGEEAEIWDRLKLPAIYFEPVAANLDHLRKRVPEAMIFPFALGAHRKKAAVFTEKSNGGQSCSLLPPKAHLLQFPEIKFDGVELTDVVPLDEIGANWPNLVSWSQFDFLYMDVQGYELEVLRGATQTLPNIKAIITEVNREEMFEGCAMIQQIDELLYAAGFIRGEIEWSGHQFGDAFYLRPEAEGH